MYTDVTIVRTARAHSYVFAEPPGGENAPTVCLDTGPLNPVTKYENVPLKNGGFRYAPTRDRMPASFAERILQSTLDSQILVLDRHPDDEFDMNVKRIGIIRRITAVYTGPDKAHGCMERMIIYVAVYPQHFDLVRKTKGFSFHMEQNQLSKSNEVSIADQPWFEPTRIYVPTAREANTGAPHLFSNAFGQNAVRGASPIQSKQDIMSEGDAKIEAASAFSSLAELAKKPVDRAQDAQFAEAIQNATGQITAMREERDAALAARDAAVQAQQRYSDLSVLLRKQLTKELVAHIESTDLFSADAPTAKHAHIRDRFMSDEAIQPDDVAVGICELAELRDIAQRHSKIQYANVKISEARQGDRSASASKRQCIATAPGAASSAGSAAISNSGVCFRVPGVSE